MRKQFFLSGAIFILALAAGSHQINAQIGRQENTVLAKLEKRRAMMNRFNAMFRIAINNDVASYQKSKTDVDPSTPNRAYSIRWNANGPLWRSDFSEIFPSENTKSFPVYSGAYDGEFYYSYNQRERLGIVEGTEEGLKNDNFLLLSFSYPDYGMIFGDVVLTDLKTLDEEGVMISETGQESVGIFKCNVYSISIDNDQRRFQLKLWLDKEHGNLPIKSISRIYDKASHSGSMSSYIVSEIKPVFGDNYVASKAQRNYFLIDKSSTNWANTSTLVLDNIRTEKTKEDDRFSIIFPPGTRVANALENPGRLEIVGGDYEDVLKIAQQDIPSKEITDSLLNDLQLLPN